MTKLLSALGLTAGATEDEALKALEALKTSLLPKEVLDALGLGEDATASEATGAALAVRQAVDALEASRAELGDLKSQISNLKSEIAARDADDLVAAAMKDGRITPAQREWAMAYAERDPEGFGAFAAKAPAMVPLGESRASSARARLGADAVQASVNRLLMVSEEAYGKFSAVEQQ